MIKADAPTPEFSLHGGTLHQLGCWLGLVREHNTFWLGAVLGLLPWSVILVLVLLQGGGHQFFSLAMIGLHVRLLVAIPLFFVCETWVIPRMAEFVRNIVSSGLVPENDLPALTSIIRRIGRMKDSRLAEIVLLLLAIALPLIATLSDYSGKMESWEKTLDLAGNSLPWIFDWYMGFCLPFFRYLMLRWFWRLGLWWYFLWHVQKLNLHLIPTHPDSAAGLGYLETVQEHFTPLVLAFSATFSASFAEDFALGTMTFESLYRLVPIFLCLIALLFIGPLIIFFPKLWVCRVTGLNEYMVMASHYVNLFDRKWVRGENPSGESLLGTADLQSLADLNNSVNVIRGMRWIPAGLELIIALGSFAILPLLPLLLIKYPVDQLAVRLFQMLTGL